MPAIPARCCRPAGLSSIGVFAAISTCDQVISFAVAHGQAVPDRRPPGHLHPPNLPALRSAAAKPVPASRFQLLDRSVRTRCGIPSTRVVTTVPSAGLQVTPC